MSEKKTSKLTWFILLLIIGVTYLVYQFPDDHSQTSSVKSNEPEKSMPIQKKLPPKPTWKFHQSKDEMTGDVRGFASSPRSPPRKSMDFPYRDIESWMGVGCENESEWVYFGFSSKPNITNNETESGYSVISTRIKWDENLEDVKLTQEWGSEFIHFMYDKPALKNISEKNKVLLELDWYSEGMVHFEYTLRGSSKALLEIRAICSKS